MEWYGLASLVKLGLYSAEPLSIEAHTSVSDFKYAFPNPL